MKDVVSYALFTNHPEYKHRIFYWQCIPSVVRAHHNFFPGWEMRVHVDNSINMDCSAQLRAYGEAGLVNIQYVEENRQVCRSMLWRMRPCWDADTRYVVCRDIDSLPSIRDRRCVDDFVNSGRAVSAITDCSSHGGFMMGGMVGFLAPEVRLRIKDWEKMISWGSNLENPSGGWDQILMNDRLWPMFFPSVCEHRFAGQPPSGGGVVCYTSREEQAARNPCPNGVAPALVGKLDHLMPFLGAPGFDVPESIRLLDEFGNPEIGRRAREAEARVATIA